MFLVSFQALLSFWPAELGVSSGTMVSSLMGCGVILMVCVVDQVSIQRLTKADAFASAAELDSPEEAACFTRYPIVHFLEDAPGRRRHGSAVRVASSTILSEDKMMLFRSRSPRSLSAPLVTETASSGSGSPQAPTISGPTAAAHNIEARAAPRQTFQYLSLAILDLLSISGLLDWSGGNGGKPARRSLCAMVFLPGDRRDDTCRGATGPRGPEPG